MTPVPAVDQLIEAWMRWEATPGSRVTVVAKQQALHAVGLDSCRAHEIIAATRRSGYSIPSAVQAAVNQLGWKEAC